MKIWSVKTTIYSLESIVVKFFKSTFCQQHLQLSLRQVAFQFVALTIYVRHPNLYLIINFLKKKKKKKNREKRKRFKLKILKLKADI